MESNRPRLNKLFVGGIPLEASEEELRTHFEAYGQIIDLIIIKDKNTKKSRGFGFVTFKDKQPMKEVLKACQEVRGKLLDIKVAEPKKASTLEENADLSQVKKVFIGGIPKEVTPEVFRQHFEQYGSVADIVLIEDKKTSEPRGFGFVTYSDSASVKKVLKDYSNHCLLGKWVECKLALPKYALSSTNDTELEARQFFEQQPAFRQPHRPLEHRSENNIGASKQQLPQIPYQKSSLSIPLPEHDYRGYQDYYPSPTEDSFRYWSGGGMHFFEDSNSQYHGLQRNPISPTNSYYAGSYRTPSSRVLGSRRDAGPGGAPSFPGPADHMYYTKSPGSNRVAVGSFHPSFHRYGSYESNQLSSTGPSPANRNRLEYGPLGPSEQPAMHHQPAGAMSSQGSPSKNRSGFGIALHTPKEDLFEMNQYSGHCINPGNWLAPTRKVEGSSNYSFYQNNLKSEKQVKSKTNSTEKDLEIGMSTQQRFASYRRIDKTHTQEYAKITEEVEPSCPESDDLDNGRSDSLKDSKSKSQKTAKAAEFDSSGDTPNPTTHKPKLEQVQLNSLVLYGFKASTKQSEVDPQPPL